AKCGFPKSARGSEEEGRTGWPDRRTHASIWVRLCRQRGIKPIRDMQSQIWALTQSLSRNWDIDPRHPPTIPAQILPLSYEDLMKRAGYITSDADAEGRRHAKVATFAIKDVTPDEEKSLLEYLAFIRQQKKK